MTISKCKVTACVLKECTRGCHPRQIQQHQPAKKPRLLQNVSCSRNEKSAPITTTPLLEVLQFFEDGSVGSVQRFWYFERRRFPSLAQLVQKVLCVIASSSPVERVFSVGGYLMRPNRASLGPNTLRNLVFLRCNFELLPFNQ